MSDITTELYPNQDEVSSGPWWQVLILVLGLLSMLIIIVFVACGMTRGCKEDSNPKAYYPDPQSVFTVSNRHSAPSAFSLDST
ncbi:hypothetical protein PFISCL1PPCAC_16966 [Pristionchus fissidentatus]|uniref:Uncharacterized protein n=1 Tax=Pristionchus fissidentatus TaxID=1538716 RepID=A0AAV5W191_9BILA|nr:hypothetical protein PFISCL1PPCAC_16966 [Pristionchus fissidentatus]